MDTSLANATGQVARWRLWWSEMEFDIVHQTGVKHQAADALSRLSTIGEDCMAMDNAVSVMTVFIAPREH